MTLSPNELALALHGVLAFVSTPFTADGSADIERYHSHLRTSVLDVRWRPEACFVCSGTGEFYSLGFSEYTDLVSASVRVLGGEVPVLAGTGYGTKLAIQFAQAAEEKGADGILVFPPYLINASQEGLIDHLKAIAQSTRLGVVVYSRDNAVLEPETVERLAQIPNIIGLKDGHGDLAALRRTQNMVGPDFVLINGMPLAEMYAPTYFRMGISGYSPNVVELLPDLTWALYHSIEADNVTEIDRLISGFFEPWRELRLRVPGYGVSLVKAGLRLQGRPIGGVRAPLVNPSADDEADLARLLERASSLVS